MVMLPENPECIECRQNSRFIPAEGRKATRSSVCERLEGLLYVLHETGFGPLIPRTIRAEPLGSRSFSFFLGCATASDGDSIVQSGESLYTCAGKNVLLFG
jgi:hypothetical protein